jgi:hypothetical protein
MTKERIIEIARRGRDGESEILLVLDAAKATDDRRLLGVCLDCFRSVLHDSLSDAACEVVQYLGRLLMDPAFRRIRPRILRTLFWIGRASQLVLPQLVATFVKRGPSSLIEPARAAAVSVAWRSLSAGNPAQRASAVAAFEQMKSLGLLNLRHFLKTGDPDPATRLLIESTIERLEKRYGGGASIF